MEREQILRALEAKRLQSKPQLVNKKEEILYAYSDEEEEDKMEEEDDDDDISLDEMELQEYKRLKEAQDIIYKKENLKPNATAAAILRSTEQINQKDLLKKKLEQIRLTNEKPFIHFLAMNSVKKLEVQNVHDDLERELAFYNQSLLTAREAFLKLQELNIPTHRPDDYFAEMIKTDEHMQRIKSKLNQVKEDIDKREERKKQKELKKFGKQVQIAKLKEKIEEKKRNLAVLRNWKTKLAGKDDDYEQLNKELDEVTTMKKKKGADQIISDIKQEKRKRHQDKQEKLDKQQVKKQQKMKKYRPGKKARQGKSRK